MLDNFLVSLEGFFVDGQSLHADERLKVVMVILAKVNYQNHLRNFETSKHGFNKNHGCSFRVPESRCLTILKGEHPQLYLVMSTPHFYSRSIYDRLFKTVSNV